MNIINRRSTDNRRLDWWAVTGMFLMVLSIVASATFVYCAWQYGQEQVREYQCRTEFGHKCK